MNNSRMTLRQLVNTYHGNIYIQSCENRSIANELTNRLKGCSGLMSIEVMEIEADGGELIAILDIPAEWLEHTEG